MARPPARAPEPQPLAGLRIAVTRAGERGSPLAAALRAKGATVHEVPLTRIETLDLTPLHEAVRRLVAFDWILLTSVNAVAHLARVVAERGAEAAMATRRLAVVGAATSAAADGHGWRTPTVQPENAQAVGMLDAMASRSDIEGARMLYPCAAGARDVLPDGLRALGALVESVPVYRSAPDPDGQARVRALVQSGGDRSGDRGGPQCGGRAAGRAAAGARRTSAAGLHRAGHGAGRQGGRVPGPRGVDGGDDRGMGTKHREGLRRVAGRPAANGRCGP